MHPRVLPVGLGILALAAVSAAQQGATSGEWTRYGGDPGSTKYAPAGSDQQGQRLSASRRLAAAGGGSQRLLARARFLVLEQLPCNAPHDRRRAVQSERHRAGRGVQSRDWRNDLGPAAIC